jgi:pimeloyl-ACP methyl ester carboxylesterase
VEHSSNRTVVLIHGTPLTPEAWSDTIRALGSCTVIAPDCTRVPASDPQSALAEQIAAQVDGDMDVVGHSFGGQIAIELALLAPHRVRTLTVMCSRDTPFPAFAATAEDVRAGRMPPVEATLARWFRPDELAQNGRVVSLTRRQLADAAADSWAAALSAIAQYDRSARTPGIRVPTTIIGAGLDGVSSPDAVTAMADRIPGADLHIRPDWAHMSPFAHVDELVPLLERAFARVA